jgi:hypothetical protein
VESNLVDEMAGRLYVRSPERKDHSAQLAGPCWLPLHLDTNNRLQKDEHIEYKNVPPPPRRLKAPPGTKIQE